MADAPETSEFLDPGDARDAALIEVQIGGGKKVLARKLDLMAMTLEGLIPLPLLLAVQKMTEMRDASPGERVAALAQDDNGRNMMSLLRRHALAAVVKPAVTEEDTGDRTTMPVAFFSLEQLMTIWAATATVPLMEPAKAARFRKRPSVAPPAPVPDGESVRPAAEPVAVPDVELRTFGVGP